MTDEQIQMLIKISDHPLPNKEAVKQLMELAEYIDAEDTDDDAIDFIITELIGCDTNFLNDDGVFQSPAYFEEGTILLWWKSRSSFKYSNVSRYGLFGYIPDTLYNEVSKAFYPHSSYPYKTEHILESIQAIKTQVNKYLNKLNLGFI